MYKYIMYVCTYIFRYICIRVSLYTHTYMEYIYTHTQIRLLGQPYPARSCPWCGTATPLTATHLQLSCPIYAARCFMAGILPADAFRYPEDAAWFIATLQTLEATGVNEPSTAKD